jgi:hypothetical protein
LSANLKALGATSISIKRYAALSLARAAPSIMRMPVNVIMCLGVQF